MGNIYSNNYQWRKGKLGMKNYDFVCADCRIFKWHEMGVDLFLHFWLHVAQIVETFFIKLLFLTPKSKRNGYMVLFEKIKKFSF